MHILISDFDWTLCPHGKPEQFTKNIAAIRNWRSAGNQMGIATGRTITNLAATFPDYKSYTDYVICNDGTEVYANGSRLISIKLRRALIDEIRQTIENFQLLDEMAIICFCDDKISKTIGNSANKIRIWFKNQDDCTYASRILSEYYYDRINVLTYLTVKENFDTLRYLWVKPQMRDFLEIIPHGVNKQTGINYIFDANRQNDIITIGDDMNDYEMIQSFDGYAIKDGNPQLLAQMHPQHIVDSLETLINQLLKSPA